LASLLSAASSYAQVTAEAELLAAIVTFFKSVGLTEKEIGIKISSRKVMMRFSSLLFYHRAGVHRYGLSPTLQVIEKIFADLNVPKEIFAEACIIVDKLDKLEKEEVVQQLGTI